MLSEAADFQVTKEYCDSVNSSLGAARNDYISSKSGCLCLGQTFMQILSQSSYKILQQQPMFQSRSGKKSLKIVLCRNVIEFGHEGGSNVQLG